MSFEPAVVPRHYYPFYKVIGGEGAEYMIWVWGFFSQLLERKIHFNENLFLMEISTLGMSISKP